jgi:hypothetical protein
MRWFVLLLVMVVACRSSPERCEKAIRHYAELDFEEKTEAELAGRPAAERDALRKKKLAAFEEEYARRVDLAVSKCTSANFSDKVDCMIDAKTAKQARACTE